MICIPIKAEKTHIQTKLQSKAEQKQYQIQEVGWGSLFSFSQKKKEKMNWHEGVQEVHQA